MPPLGPGHLARLVDSGKRVARGGAASECATSSNSTPKVGNTPHCLVSRVLDVRVPAALRKRRHACVWIRCYGIAPLPREDVKKSRLRPLVGVYGLSPPRLL